MPGAVEDAVPVAGPDMQAVGAAAVVPCRCVNNCPSVAHLSSRAGSRTSRQPGGSSNPKGCRGVI
jgi:hypothetical protein